MSNEIRYKTCFRCHESIPLYPNDPQNQELEKWFCKRHKGHMIQIVNKNELEPKKEWDRTYEIIKQKP